MRQGQGRVEWERPIIPDWNFLGLIKLLDVLDEQILLLMNMETLIIQFVTLWDYLNACKLHQSPYTHHIHLYACICIHVYLHMNIWLPKLCTHIYIYLCNKICTHICILNVNNSLYKLCANACLSIHSYFIDINNWLHTY